MSRSTSDRAAIWAAAITALGLVAAALIQFGPNWRSTSVAPAAQATSSPLEQAAAAPTSSPVLSGSVPMAPEPEPERRTEFCVQDVTPLNLRSAPDLELSAVLAAIPVDACDVEDATDPPTMRVEDGARPWRNVRWGPHNGWVVDSRLRPAQ